MANVVFGGFRPIRTISGATIPSPIYKEVANNYASPIRTYDVVAVTTDGTLIIGAAALNGALVGTCDGVSYVNASGVRTTGRYLPKNTTFTPTTVGSRNASIVAFVPCTPDVVFKVQGAAATLTTIAANIGALMNNADLTDATATTNQDYSSQCLDLTTLATTTANFRLLNISGYSVDGLLLGLNDPTVSRFEFQVVCNESAYTAGTATGV